jgi:hypothetical protein
MGIEWGYTSTSKDPVTGIVVHDCTFDIVNCDPPGIDGIILHNIKFQ